MQGWSIVLTTRFDAGSMAWTLIPPTQIPEGATARASWPLRPLKVLTSSVAATVLVVGSILERVPMPSLRTQTAPLATASGNGVGADQHDALHGTGMVATTRFELASIRATVPARLIATHTLSPSSASPDGPPGCAIVCTTCFERTSIRTTTLSS